MPTTTKTKTGSIPDLSGLISKEDLHKKGSFATYMNWARTTQYLREHAPGWEFHLEPKNEEYVWPSPDGSGYLMCFFQNGEKKTPLFPFPIMDNRNNPLPLEKISARDVSDSHRRGLCACAAFVFGLAYELWARIEIEEAAKVKVEPEKKEVVRTPKRGAAAKQLANEMIQGNPLEDLYRELQDLAPNLRSEALTQFKALRFPRSDVAGNKGLFELIKTEQHINDVKAIMEDIKIDSP
tara:strand:+ start:4398 stop:5111 length:714 start_codon:yes stop_codon:yes gene_type:complete